MTTKVHNVTDLPKTSFLKRINPRPATVALVAAAGAAAILMTKKALDSNAETPES